MILNLNKGMSLMGLLVALAIFSSIFLIFNRWTAYQRQSAVKIYQLYQAIQIAENQKQRQFLGMNCENQVQQNQILFRVTCSADKVQIRYPLGEISL